MISTVEYFISHKQAQKSQKGLRALSHLTAKGGCHMVR